MPITIRLATTEQDRQRVFRFRYGIYVQEMGRPQTYADHTGRTFEEPLDKTGRTFFAEDERGHVVGTVRTNYGRDTDFGDYAALYGMECAGGCYPERVSITTKLMVSPKYRTGTLCCRLSIAGFRYALVDRILFDFIDCNPHLEDTFQRLGYRRYTGRIQHPEYGDVLPLVLLLTDLDHFERVGSPFARVCREAFPHLAANRKMQDRLAAFHTAHQLQPA